MDVLNAMQNAARSGRSLQDAVAIVRDHGLPPSDAFERMLLDPRDAFAPAELAGLAEIERKVVLQSRNAIDPHRAGEDFDGLAEPSPWQAAHHLAFFQRCRVTPTLGTAVLAFARNEGIYLMEWVAYHRAIGFDRLVIYTNDNSDGSLELLTELDKRGVIHLVRNDTAPRVPPQIKGLAHASLFQPALADCAWIYVCDIDEFIRPSTMPGAFAWTRIGELCDRAEQTGGRTCGGLSLNWKWFSPTDEFSYVPGLSTRRFEDSRPDRHVKSIVRFSQSRLLGVHTPHLLPGRQMMAGDGRLTDPAAALDPAYELGQVNHYWSRSFEEYLSKRSRGRATTGVGGEIRGLDLFFEWNRSVDSAADPLPPPLAEALARELDLLRSDTTIRRLDADMQQTFAEQLVTRRQFNLALFNDAQNAYLHKRTG